MAIIQDDDREILVDFINESNEALEKTELVLLSLEESVSTSEEVDDGDINTIFRTFHSIKGSAGFIGLTQTNKLTHEAETLLDLIRKHKIKIQKTHINIFLEVSDSLMIMMNYLQENFTEDGFPGDIDDLKRRITLLIKEKDAPPVSNKSDKKKKKAKPAVAAKQQEAKQDEAKVDEKLLEALLTPDMIKQFVVDSNELLDNLEQDLLSMENDPQNQELIGNVFRNLHSLKGNAGFMNYTDINQICHKAETFLDLVRTNKVQTQPGQISLILQVLDFLRAAIDLLNQGKPPLIMGKIGLLDLMDESFGLPEQDDLPPGPEAEEEKAQRNKDIGKDAADVENVVKKEKEVAPKSAVNKKSEKTTVPSILNKASDVIRVDVNKLNKLMDLVGEIVISESMVSHSPDLKGMELENFEKSINYLQKNVRELQELATSMRMIPLNGVFGKMKRLVRDLASKNDKKIDLIIAGGETEVDRSVLEHISDPLVHILRNAADHGIQTPEMRIKAGKPGNGRIDLSAKQIGGEIWIVIKDDGAGLNREKILKKALEKGLITTAEMDMPNEKVWNLIFQPGFSTAEKVSNISGRGVGMDVVVKNVEKIRGRVEIISEEGVGTTINLRIPLTTAIVDGMLMRVENSIYAIPTLDIKESLQVGEMVVVDLMDGQEVIEIRNKIVPVLRLHELHKLSFEPKPLSEGIVVVTEKGNQGTGFLVDEILGQQQLVIKALPSYLGNIQGVSGCAVLGNGEICLILDLSNLIKTVEVS